MERITALNRLLNENITSNILQNHKYNFFDRYYIFVILILNKNKYYASENIWLSTIRS